MTECRKSDLSAGLGRVIDSVNTGISSRADRITAAIELEGTAVESRREGNALRQQPILDALDELNNENYPPEDRLRTALTIRALALTEGIDKVDETVARFLELQEGQPVLDLHSSAGNEFTGVVRGDPTLLPIEILPHSNDLYIPYVAWTIPLSYVTGGSVTKSEITMDMHSVRAGSIGREAILGALRADELQELDVGSVPADLIANKYYQLSELLKRTAELTTVGVELLDEDTRAALTEKYAKLLTNSRRRAALRGIVRRRAAVLER